MPLAFSAVSAPGALLDALFLPSLRAKGFGRRLSAFRWADLWAGGLSLQDRPAAIPLIQMNQPWPTPNQLLRFFGPPSPKIWNLKPKAHFVHSVKTFVYFVVPR